LAEAKTTEKADIEAMIKKVQEEDDLPFNDSTNETSLRPKAVHRVAAICMQCNIFGENLLKCLRCPAAFHGRECLGYDNPLGYRGKWLCYICKVLKIGLH
jgi:hypothetical protein